MNQRFQKLFDRLYCDEAGMVQGSSYLLIVTIVGIGMVVGLGTFRDQVVQEFGDVAVALESLDQSFSITINDPSNMTSKDIIFNENAPPAPVPGPAFPAATPESGNGSFPAGLGFEAATNEN